MNLRKAARGRPCMVRLPGVCNGNTETTVLAHIRMAGVTGAGQKAPDILGAWCCSACHDVLDGRVKTDFERDFIRLAHFEAMARTIHALVLEGVL